ncbi:MAG: TonB-dependent receptor [Prevotellaceae bacterium]|jgi:TonB-linked SusC/RagA family outer membrane protein|nr:TonB-dependent receptor [Prevotellaceae bacterium]
MNQFIFNAVYLLRSKVGQPTFFKRWSYLLLLLVATGGPMLAQQTGQPVSGLVVDQHNEPLTGASVVVAGTLLSTVTDVAGAFTINVSADGTLQVSLLGYKPIAIPVDNRTYLLITLEQDAIEMESVVVVGYGAQKKINLTGAVATVATEELQGRAVVNLAEALQGMSPGLVIEQSNSAPGTRVGINIRGLNTMNDNTPLIIIDGIPGADIQNVPIGDIEQISVLKDAASTAIYGSRGANGVILITTKKGTAGRSEVRYDVQYGWQSPAHLPEIADSWIYASLRNEALVNSGQSVRFSPEEIAWYKSGEGPNVKWMEELYRHVSPQQTHNLSITGGNDKTSCMLSLGYLNQESMFNGNDYGLKRYNARLNIVHQVLPVLKVSATAAYIRNNIRDHAYWTEWIIELASRMPPIYPLKDEDGNYSYPSGSNSNPLSRLEKGGYRQNSNDDISGTLSAELAIFDGLKLSGMIGAHLQNNQLHENRKAIADALSGDKENRITENLHRTFFLTSNILLTYEKQIGQHYIGGMAGYEYEGTQYRWFETWRRYDEWGFDIIGDNELVGDNVANRGNAIDRDIMYSVFGRATYNYAGKYLFEFNLRNDNSSKFKKGNQGKVFPSLSAAWRISEEDFFRPVTRYISSLKLRTSWGEAGNNRINNYLYAPSVSRGNGYIFGDNVVPTAYFSSYNEEIRWETTSMLDVGVDAGFFNNTLHITFDYFYHNTRDILVSLPVAGIYGDDAAVQNYGAVATRGWEVSAAWMFTSGAVKHRLSAHISDSQNEVLQFGADAIGGYDVNTIIREGYPLWSYYAYKNDGFFQNQNEVNKGPNLPGITPKPGDIRYLDKNGDNEITEDEDRFIVGNRYPRYTGGFSYGLEWNGIDFSMLWQGVGRRMVWVRGEAVEAFHNNNEGPVFNFHIDRWTPENSDATYPRLTVGAESTNNVAKSDFWIQNAAYLRLKNVQLGYTIPPSITKKCFVQHLRVYTSIQNALTFSKMKGGWDPETSDNQGGGRIYPVSRVVAFGATITF